MFQPFTKAVTLRHRKILFDKLCGPNRLPDSFKRQASKKYNITSSPSMTLLPGEGIANAEISMSCPNCSSRVSVPSTTTRKLVQQLKTRKIQHDSDNLPFKYHYIATTQKKEMQTRELFFLRNALDDTEDMKEYAQLTMRYIKKQQMLLSTMQEAISVYRHVRELIEEKTTEYSGIVSEGMNQNWCLDRDLADMRANWEKLGVHSRKFDRYHDAAIRTSLAYNLQQKFNSCK